MQVKLEIPNLRYQKPDNFLWIAGPCVVEDNRDLLNTIACHLKYISDKYKIPLIFKASYRKANRTSHSSFEGIGDQKALYLLREIKRTYQLPILTDIHSTTEAELVARNEIDIIQIPAFLCRQTDLLKAAAQTGLWINVKKGQFLSGYSMDFVVEKLIQFGTDKILLTERGSMFGYEDLIVDFRNIPIMQRNGCPVIVDITHSVQKPAYINGVTQGHPEFIETLGKCAIAAGADGIFMEVHPTPSKSPSDAKSILALDKVEDTISKLVKLYQLTKLWKKK